MMRSAVLRQASRTTGYGLPRSEPSLLWAGRLRGTMLGTESVSWSVKLRLVPSAIGKLCYPLPDRPSMQLSHSTLITSPFY